MWKPDQAYKRSRKAKERRKFFCVLDRIPTMQAPIQAREPPPPPPPHTLGIQNCAHSSRRESSASEEEMEDEESSRTALSTFRAKEEQIERKKMEIREKVFAHLGRVEEESKRLAVIRKELEAMADPTRKEVSALRKKIDALNRELKPLGQSCLKKEKKYKEAVEAFNGKNREKAQLVNRLIELVSESERLRMKKLEELSRTIESIQ